MKTKQEHTLNSLRGLAPDMGPTDKEIRNELVSLLKEIYILHLLHAGDLRGMIVKAIARAEEK